jgi:hypothetical protein
MNHPKRFAMFVEGHQWRARRNVRATEAAIIEEELRKRLEHGKERDTELPPLLRKMRPKPKKEEPSWLKEILDTFLKVRFERDGVITYRKHWLVLLGKTFFPLVAFLALVILTGLLAYQELFRDGLGIPALSVVGFMGLIYFGVFLWWGYHYLDWNNDIYQLTADQIIDIERKPLGEEQKKTAALDSILSIEHAREGIIELVFNYGDVIVNVGQTRFIFHGVHNPDRVHQDVADYIEARRRKKQDAEAEIERERLLDWFGTYQEHHDQESESSQNADWDLFPG